MPPSLPPLVHHLFNPSQTVKHLSTRSLCPAVPRNSLSLLDPFETITSLLQQCEHIDHLNQIHAHMTTTGFIHRPSIASKLIASLSSSSSTHAISTARTIACQIKGLDTYTWNALIRGYLERKDPKNSILVYSRLRGLGLPVDTYTVLFVVKACGLIPVIDPGKQVHAQIFRLGFVSEIIVQTALVGLYGMSDEFGQMQQVFDEMPHRDVVAWNSLIAAYSQRDSPSKALEVAQAMAVDKLGINEVTAVSILSACSSLKDLRRGRAVHAFVVKNVFGIDVFVQNALMEMYCKSGSISKACTIFHLMPVRNVVSWTTVINGYASNNYHKEAVSVFREMESTNMRPDKITLLSVISSCSEIGSLELAESIGKIALRRESTVIANALMRMYAKCGNILKACDIFNGMRKRTLISWTTVIQGLAMHGYGMAALIRFIQMQREGLKPDGVVFLSVLFSCSHSGLVEDGKKCFDLIINDHTLEPWLEHYGCMVDLFCRAGLVEEAFDFITNMPIEPDMILWRMLLTACRDQGRTELVTDVMRRMNKSLPEGSEDYVLMSNLFASVGEWDVVKEVRDKMKARGAYKKDPGFSFMELDGNVNTEQIHQKPDALPVYG